MQFVHIFHVINQVAIFVLTHVDVNVNLGMLVQTVHVVKRIVDQMDNLIHSVVVVDVIRDGKVLIANKEIARLNIVELLRRDHGTLQHVNVNVNLVIRDQHVKIQIPMWFVQVSHVRMAQSQLTNSEIAFVIVNQGGPVKVVTLQIPIFYVLTLHVFLEREM